MTTPGFRSESTMPVALTTPLADFFTLYLTTKNFHWHLSGPGFRDHHLLLDEQASHIFAGAADPIAERARKLGGPTSSRSATKRASPFTAEGSGMYGCSPPSISNAKRSTSARSYISQKW